MVETLILSITSFVGTNIDDMFINALFFTEANVKSANKMLNTALITMANGADNIGVYIPLFAGFAVWQIALTVCVFLGLIAVWCFLGKLLADLPVLKNILTRYKSIIVPVVYIALGVYILLKNFL